MDDDRYDEMDEELRSREQREPGCGLLVALVIAAFMWGAIGFTVWHHFNR